MALREAFSDKTDAQEALESDTLRGGRKLDFLRGMDGKSLDGQTITVSKAGPEPHMALKRSQLRPKPTYRPQADPNENFKKDRALKSQCASEARFL